MTTTASDKNQFPGRWLSALALAVAATALLAPAQHAHAQPVTNSTLYYRMGGGTPGGAANNSEQLAMKLGIDSRLRLNYSCGKFDVGLSWQTLMNGFSSIGTTVSNAVKAGIASLPLYVLQRAQPGLYELFQTYSQKADVMIAAATKSCEEMEAAIKAGQNPYDDWIKLAKGEAWKVKAQAGGDIVQAKKDIDQGEVGQKAGIDWVFNTKAGGVDSKAIQPIRDLSVAGYQVTLNAPTTTSESKDYSSITAARKTRLVKAFPTAKSLADFTTEVLGDKSIYLCTEGSSGCPEPNTTTTATGLAVKYEKEYDLVAPKLQNLVGIGGPPDTSDVYAKLQEIDASGMAISPELLDAVKKLPAGTRSIATNRLADELAMQRTVNKALIARQVLLTGMSLPQVAAAGDAMKGTQEDIDRLTHYIDDLLYESRVRKELTSTTALAIMSDRAMADARSASVPDGAEIDPHPLQDDGRVARP